MFRYLLLTASLLTTAVLRTTAQMAPVPPVPVDTVRLTLAEAEQRFAENNLALIAQQYNVTVAQAQAVQARALDNPSVYLEQDLLTRRVLRREVPDGTPGSEMIVSFQQLVSLAGRRRAAGRVAQQSALVEQFNLQDLLRNLRFQLRSSYFDLFFKQRTLKVYDVEIASLTRTVAAYQSQYNKGNIALKEVIRLKAFLFTLQNERQAILSDVASEQNDLHVLLRDPSGAQYRPAVNLAVTRSLTLSYSEQQLADTALAVRTDLRARQAYLEQQNLNLKLQQKLATPDLAVGYTYDRAGSYINNYHALTLGIAVPVFNRNQGNIQAARAQVAGGKALVDQQQVMVQTDVRQAYDQAARNDVLFQGADRDTTPFARLMEGIDQSYAKRLLTVVEYLDFLESYKNNLVQLNTLRANRVRSFEQLNFAVGKTIFRTE